MSFLTPMAFALAALLPIIVAFYFLKLRREERIVSSVYLWQEMVRDVAANAPWQRLRPNWLLLLQLLFLVALIVALARPFSWTVAAAGDHLILIVDTSASMAAVDVEPDRLTAAAERARHLASSLPADVPVTLIAAGSEVQVLLSASTDRGQLGQALDELSPGNDGADMVTALELAGAIAAGEPAAQIVVLSDGGVRLPERLGIGAEIRYLPIGESGDNQAISALSLDPDSAGRGLAAFVRVTNYGSQEVPRRLTLHAQLPSSSRADGLGEGVLVAAHDLVLPADDAVALTVPDLPAGTVALDARLEDEDGLPLDDQAWAVAPVRSGTQVQIVGPGNRFLEMAFALLPGVEVTTIPLEDYEATWASELPTPRRPISDTQSPNWLTVFDTALPEGGHYPPGALLFVGPLRSTEFFSVTGVLDLPSPRPTSASEPLLRFVDLRDAVIQRAAHLSLPTWGRPVVVASSLSGRDGQTDGDAPLFIAGEVDGRRLAVLAFDLRQSDLPLRVAFPMLVANLMGFLAPGTAGTLPETVVPGQPVAIPLPAQAGAAVVTRPDGTSERLAAEDGGTLFADTVTTGIYRVDWEMEEGGERWHLGRFGVNVFSPLESDIAPRPSLAVGETRGQAIVAERPVRQEWWRWLAWAALALLIVEWLVQYRGALAWAWARASSVRREA
jgi:Ca-activated chloride channel family protein